MSIQEGIRVGFSEAHAGLGPAYLEVRFPDRVPPVFADVLLFVEAHFSKAAEAHGITPQSIQQGTVLGRTTLTMNLPQYDEVPKDNYLGKLDDCAMQFQNALPDLIRQLTAI